jgi:hypothetical protein
VSPESSESGGDKSMFDVNPLGPMMHLKEIEREVLALKRARLESRLGALESALAWFVKMLKRPKISLTMRKAGNNVTTIAN